MIQKILKNIKLISSYILRISFSNFFYFIWLFFYENNVINKNKRFLRDLNREIKGKNILIIGSGQTNQNLDKIIQNENYQVIVFINHSIKLANNTFKLNLKNKIFIWFTGDFGRYKEIITYQEKYKNKVKFCIHTGLLPWYYPTNIKLFKNKFIYLPPNNIFFKKVLKSKIIGKFLPMILDVNIYSIKSISNSIEKYLGGDSQKIPIIPHSSFFAAILLMCKNNVKTITHIGCDLQGSYAIDLKNKRKVFKVNNDNYPEINEVLVLIQNFLDKQNIILQRFAKIN